MTRSANITIPARLIFRPRLTRWVVGSARLLGWNEGGLGTRFDERQEAMCDLIGSTRPIIEADPELRNENHILIQINWDGIKCGSRIPGRNDPGPPYHLQAKRYQLPKGILLPHEKQYQDVNIAEREFPVIVCVLDLPSLDSAAGEVNGEDAWKMRSEFFELEQGIDSLCSFLNHWGHWDNGPEYPRPDQPIGNLWDSAFNDFRDPINVVVPALVWLERQRYKTALAGTSRSWLSAAGRLNLRSTNKPPYLVVDCWSCKKAIESTITMDHLSNVRFGICKRDDCRKLFKRTTQQTRFYCGPKCAHLANVRKLRAQKKKAESKGGKHAKGKD